MIPRIQSFLLVWLFCAALVPAAEKEPAVMCGADRLVDVKLDLLRGKRVGLVTNHTGRLATGEFLVDALVARGINVVALFGPEHGVRGEADAGEEVADGIDKKTGIQTFSLYGKTTKPTPAMLQNVDVIVYDVQDVGARFYTYISTMMLTLQAAAEQHIPCVVLDRPNPQGGVIVDGPLMEDSLRSFVGMMPVPVAYGLTCGELAQMIVGEGWLPDSLHSDLTVVPMEGWERTMRWEATRLPWVNPSPNLRSPNAMRAYPGTCLLEGTNISEGRGSVDPFATFGAPFLNSPALVAALMRAGLNGVRFSSATFTPTASKFTGVLCHGVTVTVTEPEVFEPVATGITILCVIHDLAPDSLKLNPRWLGRLTGSGRVVSMLSEKAPAASIIQAWRDDVRVFREKSKKYWLYKD